MRFSSKRGRPRRIYPIKDYGTPELIHKRQHMLTLEPLDICLKKAFISHDHHWAGMHLRWLHSLRFGAPTISSLDLSQPQGRNLTSENLLWQHAREREYKQAIAAIKQPDMRALVVNICIFHHFPLFLRAQDLNQRHIQEEYEVFKEGLEILGEYFRQG